jgi:hypothetical protein
MCWVRRQEMHTEFWGRLLLENINAEVEEGNGRIQLRHTRIYGYMF